MPERAAENDAAQGEVEIGTGAVIGGGAFVTKDGPSYAIVAGVPAKTLRYRFSEKIIDAMHLIKWWEFDANDLAGITFNEPTQALGEIAEREAAGSISRRPKAFGRIVLRTKGFRNLRPAPELD